MPTDPIDDIVILPSVIGVHVVPLSVLFHAPPPVAPNQYSLGRASLPSAAIDRPPRAGPTLRQRMPLYKPGSTVDPCCAETGSIHDMTARATTRRMNFMAAILCQRRTSGMSPNALRIMIRRRRTIGSVTPV